MKLCLVALLWPCLWGSGKRQEHAEPRSLSWREGPINHLPAWKGDEQIMRAWEGWGEMEEATYQLPPLLG